MPEFIDDKIEVHFEKQPGPPSSFIWRGAQYQIVETKDKRLFLDFQDLWWRRRHRDYYVVKTDTGEVFEIYRHRGPGKRYWVLYKKLEG